MRSLIAVALLTTLQVPSLAARKVVVSKMTTTVLLDGCRRAGDTMRVDCAGHILGVFDQMSLSGLICPPIYADGVGGQAVAVALKFLNDHPENWHLPPVDLIGTSFKTAIENDVARFDAPRF